MPVKRVPLIRVLVLAGALVVSSAACALAAMHTGSQVTTCLARDSRVDRMEQQLRELVSDTSALRQEQRDSLGLALMMPTSVVYVQVDTVCADAAAAVIADTPHDGRALVAIAVFKLGPTRHFVWDPRPAQSRRQRGFIFDHDFDMVLARLSF